MFSEVFSHSETHTQALKWLQVVVWSAWNTFCTYCALSAAVCNARREEPPILSVQFLAISYLSQNTVLILSDCCQFILQHVLTYESLHAALVLSCCFLFLSYHLVGLKSSFGRTPDMPVSYCVRTSGRLFPASEYLYLSFLGV